MEEIVKGVCSGCAAETAGPDVTVCETCLPGSTEWAPCATAGCLRTSPQKFCVPCHVENRRAIKPCQTEGCPGESKFDFCIDCYRARTWVACQSCGDGCPPKSKFCQGCRNNNVGCVGCGFRTRRCHMVCKRCSESVWGPCRTCAGPTPFAGGDCLRCRERSRTRQEAACAKCGGAMRGARGRQALCADCFNTPEECKGCGGWKRPGKNEYCRKCTRAEWALCVQCLSNQTPLESGICVECAQPSSHHPESVAIAVAS